MKKQTAKGEADTPVHAARRGRRRFLGGAATLVGLPLLESLTPRPSRAAAHPPSPRRFVVFYIPNGVHISDWRPDADGAAFDLKPALAPLESLRDRTTVISGLANPSSFGPGDDSPHARGTGGFLTATRVRRSEDHPETGLSLDQVLVQRLAPSTRLPSLQLGLEGGGYSGGCDAGWSCAYQRNISWAAPSSPLPKLISPEAVFARLFAGRDATASAAEHDRRRRLRKSVLDTVRLEAETLAPLIATSDRRKLDEYFTGLRELERRIVEPPGQGMCAVSRDEPARPSNVVAHARAMNDLIVLALRCDLTRFVTFMLANSGSNRSFEFIGIRAGHHDVSHHDGGRTKLQQYRAIATWQMAQFAALARGLAAIPEGEGTLLDQCLCLFSSELGDGSEHSHHDLPMILAGGAGGALRTGRHVRAPDREPIANLYLWIVNAFGVPDSRFGAHGTRPLVGL